MNRAFLAAVMVLLAVVTLFPSRTRGLHRLATPTNRRPTARSGGAASAVRRPSIGATKLAASAARRLSLVAILAVAGLAVSASLGPRLVVTAAAIGAVIVVIAGQARAARRHAAADNRRAQLIEACDILAADLSAGRPPYEALEGAAAVCPDLRPATAAARLGGDVPAVLELASETPGGEALRAVATCWRVAEESGAALAGIIERLASSLRADEAVRRQVTTNLAGARATARLLAVLPLFGTALGYVLGADPLEFLTTSPIGWLCLALGLSLAAAGLRWTNHLATPR